MPSCSCSGRSGRGTWTRIFSTTSGSVISPIGFNLDVHRGHESTSMPMMHFISVAQSMYEVLVRPAKLSCEDGVFSWAREAPVAGDGLSVRGAGSAPGVSWLHLVSGTCGTISARRFDAGASTPTYRTSGILGGGTSAARRAMNYSGVMTRCVRPDALQFCPNPIGTQGSDQRERRGASPLLEPGPAGAVEKRDVEVDVEVQRAAESPDRGPTLDATSACSVSPLTLPRVCQMGMLPLSRFPGRPLRPLRSARVARDS